MYWIIPYSVSSIYIYIHTQLSEMLVLYVVEFYQSCYMNTLVYCDSFYKGLSPLWMRQIPYTMMKFACFERTIEALYKYVVPVPRYCLLP